jgi:hypothetical protein
VSLESRFDSTYRKAQIRCPKRKIIENEVLIISQKGAIDRFFIKETRVPCGDSPRGGAGAQVTLMHHLL